MSKKKYTLFKLLGNAAHCTRVRQTLRIINVRSRGLVVRQVRVQSERRGAKGEQEDKS